MGGLGSGSRGKVKRLALDCDALLEALLDKVGAVGWFD